MLERFTPTAKQAVADARDEAGWAGWGTISSEHLLLGLLRSHSVASEALAAAGLDQAALRARLPRGDHDAPAGLNADALATLGIDLDAVRRATDAAFGPGALDRVRVPGRRRLPMSPDAKQTLVGAVRHAQRLGQRQISSGHLLLGILDQQRGGALTVLAEAGADVSALRADMLRRMSAAA